MLSEVPTDTCSSPAADRSARGPSPAAAVLGAALLVTMSLVPALAPSAAASSEEVCVPEDQPIDVSLVIDRSGSMTGEKIENARDGAVGFVENLTDNDQSGLVSYSSSATLDDELGFDHNSTINEIESLTAGGSTATGDAIDLSHADLADRSRSWVPPTMVLLTDGKTNTGLDPIEQARQAKADGVEIFVIGLGDDVNDGALRDIASEPVDTHYYEPDADDDLGPVYAAILEEIPEPALHAGEAYGVRADVAGDQPVERASLHKTPRATAGSPAGPATHLEESVGNLTLSATVAEVSVTGETASENVTATSTTRVTDLRVDRGGETLVRAEALTTRAHAWSSPTDHGTSDEGVEAAGLQVQDLSLGANVPPDTVVSVPGGTVTLNEQVETVDDQNTTLRVNLVHVELEDGARSLDLVVSSAYAAAGCHLEASFPAGQPDAGGTGHLTTETTGPNASAGPATVSPTGCAEGTVAVSGTGCSDGDVAVSGDGDAQGTVAVSGDEQAEGTVAGTATGEADGSLLTAGATGTCKGQPCNDAEVDEPAQGHNTAVSGTQDADARQGAAASGTGPAYASQGLAASGTNSSSTDIGVAVSGTDESYSIIGAAVSGTGPASAIIGVAASGTDSAEATYIGAAVSGTGPAYSYIGAAASGTNESEAALGAAVSGTGPATVGFGLAASGTDEARGTVAVTGTGNAEGSFAAAGLTGTCNGRPCHDANATRPAEGHNTAVSGTKDADARQGAAASGTGSASTILGAAASGTGPAYAGVGAAASGTGSSTTQLGVAVSGTGPAYAGEGASASGCNGVTVDLAGYYADHDSPAPVCQDVPEASGLLP